MGASTKELQSILPKSHLSSSTWFYVVLWLGCGFSMILFNKMVLSSWDFHFPCFLTSFQCASSFCITQVAVRVFPNQFPAVRERKVTMAIFWTKLFPISVFSAAGLVLGNSAYQYISLAYIQMLKSMTPVPMLLMAFLVGKSIVNHCLWHLLYNIFEC